MGPTNETLIYVSIHSAYDQIDGSSQCSLNNLNNDFRWMILVQPQKQHRLLFHHREPTPVLFDCSTGKTQQRGFEKKDGLTQVLRVLVCNTQTPDTANKAHGALSALHVSEENDNGRSSIREMLSALQEHEVLRRFDLGMFMTIVEDRLRRITSCVDALIRTTLAQEMDYLAYCQSPREARSPAGREGVQSYLGSTYQKPKGNGFWVSSTSQAIQRSVSSRDPYGGLM